MHTYQIEATSDAPFAFARPRMQLVSPDFIASSRTSAAGSGRAGPGPMYGHPVIADGRVADSSAIRVILARLQAYRSHAMTLYVGLDVSQKTTAICIVDDGGQRIWRGECRTLPEEIAAVIRQHTGEDVRIGIETGPMTPWLVQIGRAHV